MKKYKVRCPICSKIDKLLAFKNYQCSYCNNINDINECEIINIKEDNRDIKYIKSCLKKSIITNDDRKKEYYFNIMALKYNDDKLYQYLLVNKEDKKIKFLLDTNFENEDLYFIIKNLLLKDRQVLKENKKQIIDKYSYIKEIDILKNYIDSFEEEDKDLLNSVINEKVEIIEYKDTNKDKYFSYTLITISIILSVLISVICNLTVYDDCVYATTIVLSVVPCIILSIALIKLLKIKNVILKVTIYLSVFYILSFFMTLIYNDVSFGNLFYNHLKHIINAIPNILESITKHSDIDWVEKD